MGNSVPMGAATAKAAMERTAAMMTVNCILNRIIGSEKSPGDKGAC
jgi:hypothetical protein